jgi:catechol-2,3-dioxygenase
LLGGRFGHPRTGMDVDDVVELTLETEDPDALAAFYERALGLEPLSTERGRRWLKLGDRTRLGLWAPGRHEHGDEGGRHVHFALSARPEQLDAVHARLTGELDVAVKGPVEHDGGDRSIYFRDPAGNLVEVWDYFERREGRREGVDGLG